MSTDDYRAHFGLGKSVLIDSLRVRWPDGKSQLLTHIAADQLIRVEYRGAADSVGPVAAGTSGDAGMRGDAGARGAIFKRANADYGIQFKHLEKDVIDFNIQPALPHKLSQYGPGIAVGDIDQNGYEDFYIGGSVGHRGIFFMQDAKGH